MKELKTKNQHFKKSCIMELGKIYRIHTQFLNKGTTNDCQLIQTGHKGFNFLRVNKYKTMLRKPIYQVNSKTKKIKKDQTVFELVVPDWFSKIEIIDPTTITKYIDTGEPEPEKLEEKSVISNVKNAFYRMEIL